MSKKGKSISSVLSMCVIAFSASFLSLMLLNSNSAAEPVAPLVMNTLPKMDEAYFVTVKTKPKTNSNNSCDNGSCNGGGCYSYHNGCGCGNCGGQWHTTRFGGHYRHWYYRPFQPVRNGIRFFHNVRPVRRIIGGMLFGW